MTLSCRSGDARKPVGAESTRSASPSHPSSPRERIRALAGARRACRACTGYRRIGFGHEPRPTLASAPAFFSIGGNRKTAAPSGHGSDRRWGDSAPGTSMPGAAVCGSGLGPRFARDVQQPGRVGLTVVCARMQSRPGVTAPTGAGAPSRAPGRLPPMPCREVRGTFRAPLSHFAGRVAHTCADGRHRGPRPFPGAGARAAAAARGRRSPRRPRARGRRRRVRDHLRPLLPRACSPSAGTCSAAARRRRTPCSTASPRPIGRCAAARATSSCAPGCTRSRATAASRPCGRSARRSPSTGWRPTPGPFEGMSAQVQLRADLRELVDELQRLPDDQRAALVLFELGDESHAQIAAVLGVRREKVKALVFQAREALMRARDGARDSVRRDPRAARDRHRPGPAAQHGAQPHRPLPRLRGVRARGAPPARRARGDPARWCRPSA